MPYQGPNGYVPPGQYGSGHGGRGFRADGHPQTYGSGPPQAAMHLPQYQNFDQPAYRGGQSQTQYSTPQFFDQSQATSFYQTPPSQYQQQQPYLSPPSQTAHIPQRYSPDPLQYYQPPPQPRLATPTQGRPQQHQPPQRTPSQSQRPPSQSQPTPNSQPQRSSFPRAPHADPTQYNATAAVRNSQLPPQQQGQHSQARPVSGSGGPGFAPQRLTPQDLQRQANLQRTSLESVRPSSAHATHRPGSQSSDHQAQISQPQYHPAAPPGTINPNAMHHKIAHVQLPTQRSASSVKDTTMARSPKRRRSNDGQPVPVCGGNTAPRQPPAASRVVKQEAPASSPLTELTSSQMPATPTPTNLNYKAVLIGLSDEYINAAYSMSVDLSAAEVSEEELDKYHSLLATGMGCLDSVLRNYHISDSRLEARIRLRLASLLCEETENDMDAEEVLTKGISVCDRARLQDLKYAMHHLLARVWFKAGKVKAAMKAVDKLIVEVEKLKLVHWVYTFRFLRVTLGVQVDITIAETAAMVRNLSAIMETADDHGHVSVQIMASLLETLIHLRSRTPESVDLAQRALATARMHQLSPVMASMPRFQCLLDFLDLSCSLVRFNHDQVNSKSDHMQKTLDTSARSPSWGKDGGWQVSFGGLPSSSCEVESDTGGILKKLPNGECAFTFRWLTKPQIHTLGFLLAGLAGMNKNASHEQKAEAFLNEGVKLAKRPLDPVAQSLPSATSQCTGNTLLLISLGLYAVFACCGRCDWDKALKGIASIRRNISGLESPPGEHIASLISYLEALCKHGLGDLQGALELYHSPELKTDQSMDAKAAAGSVDPIRVLAALNSIPIMRYNGDHQAADELLTSVQKACLTNPNSNGNEYGSKPMEAAFYILKATEDSYRSTDNVIIKTKTFLNHAVQAAKGAVNNQLLCIIMNIMTDSFFTNIVGDQAEKSGKAAKSLATKSQDKLWTAVADEMYGNTLERAGRIPEARSLHKEAQDAMRALPESLKTALLRDGMKQE